MKKRLLLGLCAVLCLCTVCFCLPKPRTVIQQFKYSELGTKLKLKEEWHSDASVTEQRLKQRIEGLTGPYAGVDEKGNILPTTSKYGFVGIIEPLYSINYVYRFKADDQTTALVSRELISPFQVYDDLQWRERQKECELTGTRFDRKGLEWSYFSAVVTEAVIKEVLYLPKDSEFKTGDTIRIQESYMVYDGRIPHCVDLWYDEPHCCGEKGKYAVRPYGRYDYAPLEDGETYFMCGYLYTDIGREEMPIYREYADTEMQGSTIDVFCISDKTKQAGDLTHPEQLKADYAYIAEHFGY